MTRIGFAYNQKPELGPHAAADAAEGIRADEEPPSRRRDDRSRNTIGAALHRSVGGSRSPSPASAPSSSSHAASALPTSDEYAEWDTLETIAAVERALSALGEVIRLEAN